MGYDILRQVEISRIVRKKLLSLKEGLTERFDENVASKSITSLVSAMDSLGLVILTAALTLTGCEIINNRDSDDELSISAFRGHNTETGYPYDITDLDFNPVWGSADLIVYTCMEDYYNIWVTLGNRN